MTSALQARFATRSRNAAPSGLTRVAGWLSERLELPRFQQQAFTREWRRLAPRIKAAAPTWEPPETGYFSVIDVPFETLLDRHALCRSRGFEPVERFGDYDQSPFHAESPQQIVVCRNEGDPQTSRASPGASNP